jgi:hypothetical protein
VERVGAVLDQAAGLKELKKTRRACWFSSEYQTASGTLQRIA